MKKPYKNNRFNISAPTWNEEFQLPDGSYSISDTQYYFEYIFKNIGKRLMIPIRKYINIIENRIMFKIKTGCYLQLLTPETLKLVRSDESRVTKNKNSQHVLNLKITELVLVHCNIANNNYEQNSSVLYTFVSNKSFGHLLDILPNIFIFLKTFDSKCSYIEVWFTVENSKLLDRDRR